MSAKRKTKARIVRAGPTPTAAEKLVARALEETERAHAATLLRVREMEARALRKLAQSKDPGVRKAVAARLQGIERETKALLARVQKRKPLPQFVDALRRALAKKKSKRVR